MSYIFYKKLTVKNCTNNWGGNINQSFHMTLLRNTQVPIKHLLLISHKLDTANCFSFFFLEMHCYSCGMWKKICQCIKNAFLQFLFLLENPLFWRNELSHLDMTRQCWCCTANVYRALQVFAEFPCCGETLQYLQIAGKSYNYHGVSPQSVNMTGLIHNIHRDSMWFLKPFSIYSAGFPYRDHVIPSPCSFHWVKICTY